MKKIFIKTFTIVIFCFSHNIIFGQNSLPTSGPVVINNTLTVMGGTAFGSTVGMTNNYFLYWNDAGGTARRIIGLTSSNNVHIGDVDNILNGSNIFQTKNNHSFYNNGNYTFGINSIGQTYFANNVWHASIDGKKRFYYALNSTTYFGTNDSYVFRSFLDKDIALITATGSIYTGMNQTTADANVEVGLFRKGNGYSYIDFIGDSTYNDYGLRLIRGNAGINTDSYLQNRGTGTLNIEAVDAGGIALKTNGNNRLSVSPNGNVGIGTANPDSPLQIHSNISSIMRFQRPNANIFGFEISGNLFGLYDYSNSVFRWRATGNNLILNESNGNVGIGTTSPVAKFEVAAGSLSTTAGSTVELARYVSTLTNNGSLLFFNKRHTSGTDWTSAGTRIQQRIDATDMGYIEFNPPNGNYGIAFGTVTGAGEIMRIQSNGNVGIGTTSPAYKLDVTGESRFADYRTFYTHSDAQLRLGNKTGNGSWSLGISGDPTDNFIFFNNRNGNIPITIPYESNDIYLATTAGNVGIGTSSTAAKLYVDGDIGVIHGGKFIGQAGSWYQGNQILLDFVGNTYGRIQAYDGSNSTPKPLALNQEGGNVGIGTTNPQSKLQITGDNSIISITPNQEGQNRAINFMASTTVNAKYASIELNSTSGNLQFRSGSAGSGLGFSTSFFTDNIERMKINSTGQVVIGSVSTLPADYKLAVAGNVIAEKVKVKKSNTWPDFVFSPSYKLPNLTEVEIFVKQNSHLPEIPSAAEIEKDGQDLGEMNRLLLKKVEELTLYLIEQNKEIKTLKSKVELLEKK